VCGICGVLRLGERPIDAGGLLDRMTDSLAHRGPDDRGTWSDGRVALGHRRLAVIDLSRAGRQPMHGADGGVHLVYNGELYNFRELAERFGLHEKYRFESRTDSEVLLHLYEECGPGMAPLLNGMFAFALWDARRQQLHLVRDPYGVKPLFVQRDGDFVRFGSEIKAILADARVPRRPSLQALHDFLTFDYVPGEQTAFEGIAEVPPGHWMTIGTDGAVESRRFWEASWEIDEGIDAGRAAGRALELMDRAVERQLVADVPVGVLLSGGMDSSALVALMSRRVPEAVHTFSIGFEDTSFDERPWARVVADAFGTKHREVVIDAGKVRDLLPAYLRWIDEPYADGSAIPTWYVCRLAREEVVVVLSGEGGDEAFAGYDTYGAWRAAAWGRRLPTWLRHGLLRPLVDAFPVSHGKLSLEFKLKRFLGGLDLPPAEAHLWWRVVLTEAQKLALYTDEMREALYAAALEPSSRHFTRPWAEWEATGPGDELARLLRLDARVFLPDDLMIKNDRMSMAHSLEARVPFTDPELTDFLSRLPARVKLPGLERKAVMRRALQELLPAPILAKKKVGLEMPYSRWLRGELRDLLDVYLDPDALASTGLLRPDAVARLVEEHVAMRYDHGRALWGLLNYMMWWETSGVERG
jgi:asparagine synthase (glutamine-hydrolysing)